MMDKDKFQIESIVQRPSHLSNRLPSKIVKIECISDDFNEIVQNLNKHDVIGISLEGTNIGRSGVLNWLNISSSECTYLFNVTSLGKDAFDNGLKMLFENKRVVKVFHDCRRASDCFYHQYNTKLANVYDTQVADFVVNVIKKKVELINNKVNSLNHCLEVYLNVSKEYLRGNSSAILTLHLLNNDTLELFVNKVIYLRILKHELDIILRMPFRRCVDVYLQTILRKPDHELKLCRSELELVPPELIIENMQLLKLTEKLKPPDCFNSKDKESPFVRYERDCKRYQEEYGYVKCYEDKEVENGFNYENLDVGYSYSSRREIIQYLLDKMFSCDSSDRSVISMTPFENIDEGDDFSVASNNDISNRLNSEGSLSKSLHNNVNTHECASDSNYLTTSNVPTIDNKLSNNTLPDRKKCESYKTSESLTSDSSLSGKSQVYKIFAKKEQKTPLNSMKTLTSGVDPFSFRERSEDAKRVLNSESSSDSSLSGKSAVYKILGQQKNLLSATKKLSETAMAISSENFHSTTNIKSNVMKEGVGNEASNSLPSCNSLSSNIKKLLNHKNLAESQSSNTGSGKRSYNLQPSISPNKVNHNSNPDEESNACDNSSEFDNINLNQPKEDIFSDTEDQNGDPWTKLRDAFAELGPTCYSSKKVVFIPAGMQY